MFSSHLLVLSVLLLFGLIAGTYRTVSFFMGDTTVFHEGWIFWLLFVGYLGQSITFWWIVYCLGITSDLVHNQVINLLAELTALDLEDDSSR